MPILKQGISSPCPCFPLLTFLSLVCFKEKVYIFTCFIPIHLLQFYQCAFCPNFYWNFLKSPMTYRHNSPRYFLPPYLPTLGPPWQNMLMRSSLKSSVSPATASISNDSLQDCFSPYLPNILPISGGFSSSNITFMHMFLKSLFLIQSLFSNSWHTWPLCANPNAWGFGPLLVFIHISSTIFTRHPTLCEGCGRFFFFFLCGWLSHSQEKFLQDRDYGTGWPIPWSCILSYIKVARTCWMESMYSGIKV